MSKKSFLQRVFDLNARAIAKIDARIDGNVDKLFDNFEKSVDRLDTPSSAGRNISMAAEFSRAQRAGYALEFQIGLRLSLFVAGKAIELAAKVARRPLEKAAPGL